MIPIGLLTALLLLDSFVCDPYCTLSQGKRIERQIGPGETQSYIWAVEQGQYVRFLLQQQDMDLALAVKVTRSEGITLREIKSPLSPPIPFSVSFIADVSGDYRIEIQSMEKEPPARTYLLSVETVRSSTEPDRIRISAEESFLEAEQLRAQRTRIALQESVELYQQALLKYRAVPDYSGEAFALTGTARSLDALGEKKKAIDLLRQALALHRNLGNTGMESYVLGYLGLAHDFLGERTIAMDFHRQAMQAARKAGNRRVEALTFNNTGLLYYNLGEKEKALEHYRRALAMNREVKNVRGEAVTLNNMATLYDSMGEKRAALDHFLPSLELQQRIGDPREQAVSLNNICALYFSMDELEKGFEYCDEALAFWKVAGDQMGEAATLHNKARVYHSTGEYRQALRFYYEAMSLQRAVQYRVGEGNSLTNVSAVYSAMGDYPKALETNHQALLIHREVKNRAGEAQVLMNLGSLYHLMGQPQKAMDAYMESLKIRRAVQDPYGEALTLNHIARLQVARGDARASLDLCDQALSLMRKTGSRRGEALAMDCLGAASASLGDSPSAVEYFRRAVHLFQSVEDRQGQATSLQRAATVEWTRGNIVEARNQIEAAVRLQESLRATISTPELRSLYLASVRDSYQLYIDILMQLHLQSPSEGLDAEALHISEMARARSLMEMLAEGGIDIRKGVPPELLRREQSLRRLLNARTERQIRLVREDSGQAEAIAKEIYSLTNQYREVLTQIKTTGPAYAGLTQPRPLKAAEIQEQILDADTLLLEFTLGPERSYVWALSKGLLRSYVLPGQFQIDEAARHYYELIRSNGDLSQIHRAGRKLSRILLSNVAPLLGKKRLLIVAEGSLQFVPFAALPDPEHPEQPLVVQHQIVSLPSASVLSLIRKETDQRLAAPGVIAVLADPVFLKEDPRVRKANALSGTVHNRDLVRSAEESGIGGFRRLIGTRREAAAILSLVPPDQHKLAMDFEASRTTATASDLSRFRIIHFATHGLLNSKHPELSGLVFSLVNENGEEEDGFLRLDEIYNLNLPAELVVLSACQTALGTEIKGEGLIGLTRGFMYAGASRVVASLWKVDDRATSEFMKLFYGNILGKEPMPAAAAMQEAQIAMQKQGKRQSPYYWAAFLLQGEWK